MGQVLATTMNSSDYLENSQGYDGLYPQTVMDSDSQDSPGYDRKPPFYSPGQGKHFDCYCGKIFISKADFNRHMLVHTGERPHECEICGKAFSLKGNLTKHMLLHSEEKPYHCPECGKSFLKKGYIDQHMRTHTGEKPFVCPHCNRAFSLRGNLAQHIKLHTDEKSYHCLECNKMFLKKSYLVQHMRVHAGDRPHKCSLCNKAFNLKGNLVQHMKRHSGRKPFKCIDCGKAFALKGALREHEKIHGGDKPFVCNVCGKAFNKKAYLTQHERTHTGERPFHCIECGKSFSQRSILNQHMKMHGERSYKCCQCHKIFLKKLNTINKCIKNNRFTGFKCSDCDEEQNSPNGNLGFMKEENTMGGYDAQSYIQDDNMSIYNLDSPQKVEDLDRMRLVKLTRLEEEFATSSDKQNSTTTIPESNGLSERLYQYEVQNEQTSMPSTTTDVKKFIDYNQQKKVAVAHTAPKESKRSQDQHSKAGPLLNQQDDHLSSHSKKVEATYTELKVVEKHRIPGSSQTTNSFVPKHPGKLDALLKQCEDRAKYASGRNALASDCQKGSANATSGTNSTDKSQQNHSEIKTTSDHSSKAVEDASKVSSDKTIEYLKKHPALISIDAAQNSALEDNDARRALLYSQPSLSDYNARNMDSLRYIENLQRNFASGIRHGNMPEVESALSRFGIKGYYNSPWSFAGNYPE